MKMIFDHVKKWLFFFIRESDTISGSVSSMDTGRNAKNVFFLLCSKKQFEFPKKEWVQPNGTFYDKRYVTPLLYWWRSVFLTCMWVLRGRGHSDAENLWLIVTCNRTLAWSTILSTQDDSWPSRKILLNFYMTNSGMRHYLF